MKTLKKPKDECVQAPTSRGALGQPAERFLGLGFTPSMVATDLKMQALIREVLLPSRPAKRITIQGERDGPEFEVLVQPECR